MTIALFKSVLQEPAGDGVTTVWEKLRQRVVEAAEVPALIAEGWYKDASEALEAHELAKLEAENAKLEASIAAEQVKLDGRTKAAKEMKAKSGNVPAETDSSLPLSSTQTADESQTSATQLSAPAEVQS